MTCVLSWARPAGSARIDAIGMHLHQRARHPRRKAISSASARPSHAPTPCCAAAWASGGTTTRLLPACGHGSGPRSGTRDCAASGSWPAASRRPPWGAGRGNGLCREPVTRSSPSRRRPSSRLQRIPPVRWKNMHMTLTAMVPPPQLRSAPRPIYRLPPLGTYPRWLRSCGGHLRRRRRCPPGRSRYPRRCLLTPRCLGVEGDVPSS